MKDRWLTVQTLQERLNIGRSHAYQLIGQGHFIAMKVGAAVRVSEQSLEAFIRRQISLFMLDNGIGSAVSTESVEYSESADAE